MQGIDRQSIGDRLLQFVKTRLIGDPGVTVKPNTALVSSGLVDSFDLVELLTEVERISGKALPTGRLSPQDLESVEKILDLIEGC